MAKPLTKKTKDGATYTRPTEVEAAIDGAIDQPLEVIRQRLQVTSMTHSDYLTTECTVHLFRDAVARGDEDRQNVLFEALMRRVERVLLYKIRDGDLPAAAAIRGAAMDKFTDLLAAGNASLDFYEVRFNRAFAHLYISIIRTFKEQPPHVSFEDRSEPPNHGVAMSDAVALRTDLLAAIRALPPEERRAFVLVEQHGYDVESKDPGKRTVATLCGVSGRTIRDRVARAKKKLAQFIEDVNA